MIHETNDLIGGMEKIGKEQDEYYILGYTPPDSEDGSCHTLRVKVDRGGTEVRARTGYCNSKPQDLLAGNSTEKDLGDSRGRGAGRKCHRVHAASRTSTPLPTWRASTWRMEIATENVKFEKQKGKYPRHRQCSGFGLSSGRVGGRSLQRLPEARFRRQEADGSVQRKPRCTTRTSSTWRLENTI